jgi:hypothetical protein
MRLRQASVRGYTAAASRRPGYRRGFQTAVGRLSPVSDGISAAFEGLIDVRKAGDGAGKKEKRRSTSGSAKNSVQCKSVRRRRMSCVQWPNNTTDTLGTIRIRHIMSAYKQPNRQPSDAQKRFAYKDMERHRTNRFLHAFLSVITAGLWLLVWLAVSIHNTRRRNQIAREYGLPTETNVGFILLFFLILFSIAGYRVYSGLFSGKPSATSEAVIGPATEQAKPDTNWVYAKTNSPVGRGSIVTATTYSLNEIELGPPYEGKQRAVLTLRKNFNNSHDVYFGLEKGQFRCDNRACGITARFDSGLVQFFEAAPAQNESEPGGYLSNAGTFIHFAEAAGTVTITAALLDQREQTFQFDTRGLRWR